MSVIKFPINPPVIAHRGASGYAPENTLIAFKKAKELGINWVEFDVMLTSDGEVIVIHDETLDRTTNAKGNVIDFSFEQIKTFDAGSWFDPRFSNARVPSLREVIEFLRVHNMSANIEIKAQEGMEEITVKKVLEILQQDWVSSMPAPLISSFSLPSLEYVRQYSKHSLLGFLMHDWMDEWQEICERLHCVSVNVNEEILTQERVNQIKATKRWLLSYTVNTEEMAKKLYGWGVDAVFSDFPDKILRAKIGSALAETK